jgi:hypothetical protein
MPAFMDLTAGLFDFLVEVEAVVLVLLALLFTWLTGVRSSSCPSPSSSEITTVAFLDLVELGTHEVDLSTVLPSNMLHNFS